MITCKSPLRITLAGGGTDLPSYYKKKGSGRVLSVAINKYVYITINKPFINKHVIRYSEIERIKNVNEIRHNIFREAFKLLKPLDDDYIEISSMADCPSGTGLGSSGAFTVALLNALSINLGHYKEKKELAEMACEIEINKLKNPVGKQDQYISAFGGIKLFDFLENEEVIVNALPFNQSILESLNDKLLLFFTGISREANNILIDQDERSKISEDKIMTELDEIKNNVNKIVSYLSNQNFDQFGLSMNEHWMKKKERSPGMSSPFIDECYLTAINNGALGGKLVGAGGGGFFLLYTNDPQKLRNAMTKKGLREMRFSFDEFGSVGGRST